MRPVPFGPPGRALEAVGNGSHREMVVTLKTPVFEEQDPAYMATLRSLFLKPPSVVAPYLGQIFHRNSTNCGKMASLLARYENRATNERDGIRLGRSSHSTLPARSGAWF